jgi:hypothetical protein
MISQATKNEIVESLEAWRKANHVPKQSMVQLLVKLTAIPGNTSYRNSVMAIAEEFKEKI